MIDIHSHILYGIDDGATTIEDSLNILKEAEKLGFSDIILTPHFIKGSKFICNNKDKRLILKQIKDEYEKRNGKINLYLGNEIYYENNMLDLIMEASATTLNNSRYMLFELPMHSEVNNLREVIFNLKVKGVIPVMAHPERYEVFQKDPNELYELINQGCLMQCNFGSLVGIYGKEASKCIKTLLKHDMVHFMATDVHRYDGRNYTKLNEAIIELEKIVTKDYLKELTEINPLCIINDENIGIRDPKEVKKKLFSF